MRAKLQLFMRWRIVRAIWLLIVNLDRYAAPRAASAMAFDAFLSIIPLVALAGVVLHRFQRSGATSLGPFWGTFPPAVSQLLDSEFLRLSDAGIAVVAPLGFFAFAWVMSSGLSTALGVFECIYVGTERPWYKRRLIALACVLGCLLLVTALTAGGFAIANVAPWLGKTAAFALPPLVTILLVAGFFRLAMRRGGGPKRRVFPGAILTVVLWAGASTGFSIYASTIASYATLYGGLATVAIALLWLWLSSMSLLVGGEVNALLDGVGVDAPDSMPFPFEATHEDLPGDAHMAPSIRIPPAAEKAAEPADPRD